MEFNLNGIWIAAVSAVIGNTIAYALAFLSKSDSHSKPSAAKTFAVLLIFFAYLTGVTIFCTIYSMDYGASFGYMWLVTFAMAFGFDLLVLGPMMCLLHCAVGDGGMIEKIRMLKVG